MDQTEKLGMKLKLRWERMRNHPPLLENHGFSGTKHLIDLQKKKTERNICLGLIIVVQQSSKIPFLNSEIKNF